ncbi:MAG TPA: type II toxin-antitoxin system VapC family toxin [Solirubrobacterales bacterium]|nr:type II toxin-antitoxin system VapC family toxin [Solirubrobacterales bacterium]
MVVLDSWALLAYLKDEPPAARIEAAWLEEGATICSINLGEVLYIRMRGEGEDAALSDAEQVRKRLDVFDPDWPLVSAAARVKARGGLAYADAFCIATALRLDAPLWTGDPEIVTQAGEHSCEVVDLRDSKA